MIEKEDRSFGPFGTGVDTVHKSRKRRRMSFILLLVFLAVAVPAGLFAWKRAHDNFLEKVPPKISFLKVPGGIGAEPVKLEVVFEDKLSGLSEILVRYEQNRKIVNIVKQKITDKKVNRRTIPLSLGGRELGLVPGKVKLSFVAFDSSFWSNSRKAEIFLDVDFTPPEIDIITTEHNAAQSGVELVFYRVNTNNSLEEPQVEGESLSVSPAVVPSEESTEDFIGFSGVRMSTWIFPGFPARHLDRAFGAYPDLYFSLFPVPQDYQSAADSAVIFARDRVGNYSLKQLPLRISKSSYGRASYPISPENLALQVEKAWQDYQRFNPEVSPLSLRAEDNAGLIERYRELNVQFRKEIDKKLVKLLSKPRMTRYWRGRFGRQPGFTRLYGFGETQNYELDGFGGGVVVSGGTGYSSLQARPVRAANEGIVVFCDRLGPWGETVVLDHGFGLSSVYSNLSKCSVPEGKRVSANDVVGQSGRSGLFQFSGVHFEIRVHGVPVRPEEWWDRRWLRDHLSKKIDSVKRELSLPVIRSINQ